MISLRISGPENDRSHRRIPADGRKHHENPLHNLTHTTSWRGPHPRTRHRPDPPRSPAPAGSRDRSASTIQEGETPRQGAAGVAEKFAPESGSSTCPSPQATRRPRPTGPEQILSQGAESSRAPIPGMSARRHTPKTPRPTRDIFFARNAMDKGVSLPGELHSRGFLARSRLRKRCRLRRKKTRMSPFPAGEDVSGPETADRAPPGRVVIPFGTAHALPCRSGTFRTAGERGQSLRPPVHLLSSLDIETKFRLSASFFQQKEDRARLLLRPASMNCCFFRVPAAVRAAAARRGGGSADRKEVTTALCSRKRSIFLVREHEGKGRFENEGILAGFGVIPFLPIRGEKPPESVEGAGAVVRLPDLQADSPTLRFLSENAHGEEKLRGETAAPCFGQHGEAHDGEHLFFPTTGTDPHSVSLRRRPHRPPPWVLRGDGARGSFPDP